MLDNRGVPPVGQNAFWDFNRYNEPAALPLLDKAAAASTPAGCRFNPRCPLVMDICTSEQPPVIGEENNFALCWWFQQQTGERAASELLKEAEAK